MGGGGPIYISPNEGEFIYVKYSENDIGTLYVESTDITDDATASNYFYSIESPKEVTMGDFIVGGDPGYSYSDNVLTISGGGEYTISMADPGKTTTSDTIKVTSGSDVTITLDGVLIENSLRSPFEIDANGKVTIKLKGESYFNAGDFGNCAGLQKTSDDNELVITSADGDGKSSGKLTATGDSGAGIGGGNDETSYGGDDGDGINIIIRGGTVTAESRYGAGIGSGDQGSGNYITIESGTVTAASVYGAGIGGGDQGSGSNITISGGTVTAASDEGAGIGGGAHGGSGSNIYISPVGKNKIYVKYSESGEESVYSEKTDITEMATASKYFAGRESVYTGDFIVEPNRNVSYSDNVLTIIGSGEYTISMASPGAVSRSDTIKVISEEDVTITLDNVLISNGLRAPIEIDSTGDVTLKLNGENSLTAIGGDYAGLQKTSMENMLVITNAEGNGSTVGSLMAEAFNGAAIGSGGRNDASNITITDGTITAESTYGSGIGGGADGSGSNITITGGTITAISDYGTGIGGGSGSDGSKSGKNITIKGGTVTATSTYGAGVGGTEGSESEVYISPNEGSALSVKYAENGEEVLYIFDADVTENIGTYFYSNYSGKVEKDNENIEIKESSDGTSLFNVIVNTNKYGGEGGRYLDSVSVLVNDSSQEMIGNYQESDDGYSIVFPVEVDASGYGESTATIRALITTYDAFDADKESNPIYYISDAITYNVNQ